MLHKIEIRNFKAFREFKLDLEDRHLLVYGPNGSGKSSLYWALYTFLQSAGKPTAGVAKYFDPADPHNLLNIHEQLLPSPKPGEIAITVRDSTTKLETRYPISKANHSTVDDRAILKADLASDFVTYRFFFGFSNFRHSQRFDLWPLFETEILPFCVSIGAGSTPLQQWNRIKSGVANPTGNRGSGGSDAYSRFKDATDHFATTLTAVVADIGSEAQRFYDEHFSADDPAPIRLALGVTRPPSFSGTNRQNSDFKNPIVELHIEAGGKVIKRPQSFLNEAKMTQLALSVRFAASLVNLHESGLKLLVLDDLLVSLDMSNRMKVVEILLSDTFANYQKIILTHELGFFREFRRKLGAGHPDWCFFRLEGTADTAIECKSEKTDIQKAEEYLHGHNLDEAALCLRKACEDTAKRFIEHNQAIPTKEFVTLTGALRAARKKIHTELPVQLYEKVLRNTPDAHRDLLVASSDDDLENNAAIDNPTKGRLKTNRERLRRLVKGEHVERMRQIKLIEDILACTERVLNPAAHSGNPPIYQKEVQDALNLIKQLESTLTP